MEQLINEINLLKDNILNGNLCKWDIEIRFNKINKKIQKIQKYGNR